MDRDDVLIEIDGGTAHPARIYDHLLGGVDNFHADRVAADTAFACFPGGLEAARSSMQANRRFLERVVHHLVEDGVRQLLDIGAGIPTRDGHQLHQIAQRRAPDSRVVYVDIDPIVQAHAHRLGTTSTPTGRASYLDADLRDPEAILEQARESLDFDQPIAVLLGLVLDFVDDDHNPHGLVARLLDAVPHGSHLAISHLTGDLQPDQMNRVAEGLSAAMRESLTLRPLDEVARFFDGLDLIDPGIVQISRWRGEPGDRTPDHIYGGLGRKRP